MSFIPLYNIPSSLYLTWLTEPVVGSVFSLLPSLLFYSDLWCSSFSFGLSTGSLVLPFVWF